MSESGKTVAIFVDAENTSPQLAPIILQHAKDLGLIALARVYGKAALAQAWEPYLKDHCWRYMVTPAAAAECKNASDFAMTIDAVALFYSARYDHALVVSRDGGFLQLVMHVHDHGGMVTGAGLDQESSILRTVCDNWIGLSMPTPVEPVNPSNVQQFAARPGGVRTSPPASIITQEQSIANAGNASAIDRKKLLGIFDALSIGKNEVSYDAFCRALGQQMPDAKKNHRNWRKALEPLNLFTFEDKKGIIRLKATVRVA